MVLERELARHADGGLARMRAEEVNREIAEERQRSSAFARASQNIAAAVALLDGLPAVATPEKQRSREKMPRHLHLVAEQ